MGLSRCYATDIEPTEREWLWRGYLERAAAAIYYGDGGIGKGLLLADIAARVTRGDVMPDGSPGLAEPGDVLMVTLEDDPSKDVWWRLMAAKADMHRVHDMSMIDGVDFCIGSKDDHLDLLRQEILELGNVRLVIIDPLSQASEKPLTSVATVRKWVWGPISRVAKDTGPAVAVMCHTTKKGDLAGSAGLQQAARLQIAVRRDKYDRRLRTITVEKSNNYRDDMPPVVYTLANEDTEHDVCVEYVDMGDVASLDRGRAHKAVVQAVLRADGPIDGQTAAELSKVPYNNARVILHRAVRSGELRKVKRGLYGAPELTERSA